MTKAISEQQYLMVPSEEFLRPFKVLTAGGKLKTWVSIFIHKRCVLGVAGAVSRTITAPIDRLKMILMVNNETKAKGIKWGLEKMRSEGKHKSHSFVVRFFVFLGSFKAWFKGNGTNVLKIAPETAIKLAATDSLKTYIVQDPEQIHPSERIICGGIAGAIAQVINTTFV